ncbi:hypothetical protein K438DRAFT_1753433 [Mycena galopus ATCC 62051]|nr:hypothetical protein K438DRAFT_1753433 [Mycena galopus ATCC 62051]
MKISALLATTAGATLALAANLTIQQGTRTGRSNHHPDNPLDSQPLTSASTPSNVDPTLNNDTCITALSDAGIYVILDLALLHQTIDAFSKYSNILAYNVGNEVLISSAANTVPFIKAAARDTRPLSPQSPSPSSVRGRFLFWNWADRKQALHARSVCDDAEVVIVLRRGGRDLRVCMRDCEPAIGACGSRGAAGPYAIDLRVAGVRVGDGEETLRLEVAADARAVAHPRTQLRRRRERGGVSVFNSAISVYPARPGEGAEAYTRGLAAETRLVDVDNGWGEINRLLLPSLSFSGGVRQSEGPAIYHDISTHSLRLEYSQRGT